MHYEEPEIRYEDIIWIEVAQVRFWLQTSMNILNLWIP
jgi:hypothetical protein